MRRVATKMLIGAVGLGVLVGGCQATRAGYETAPYRVVRADGRFEVRDYDALRVVETAMGNARAEDGSFMRLFRFITGANERQERIAMTTPVLVSSQGTNAVMAFVMPAAMRADEVPGPSDGAVVVRELPAGRFAVLRYSGGRDRESEASALARLRSWMEQEKLSGRSTPVYGYFDPPWTPGFLRRNEVMLRVESGGQVAGRAEAL